MAVAGMGPDNAPMPVTVVDAAGNPGGGTSAAAADAESNATLLGAVRARLSGFNGTTWDRLRSGITTVSSTLTGFLNALPWAVFHTTPTTRIDGQGGPLESDAAGNLQMNLATRIAGEDITNDKLVVEHRYTNARVTASGATNAIKSGAGVLHTLTVDKWVTTLVIDVYDALTVTGTPIRKITLTATDTGPFGLVLDISFTVGLTLNLSAAGDVGLSYR